MQQWQLFDYSFYDVTISIALKLIPTCCTFHYSLKHWKKKPNSFECFILNLPLVFFSKIIIIQGTRRKLMWEWNKCIAAYIYIMFHSAFPPLHHCPICTVTVTLINIFFHLSYVPCSYTFKFNWMNLFFCLFFRWQLPPSSLLWCQLIF